jgi:16S rRNA (adenine1518-N6/adenine1519-N6)-dimethyltransferase
METITAAAFGQRRKMLRAALKSLPGAVEALAASGIDPTRRAENAHAARVPGTHSSMARDAIVTQTHA